MKKVETNVSTSRSPQEVYDYLVDFENQEQWRFDVLESKLVEGETGSVGARYRQRTKQGGREMEVLSELTEADAPRTVAFRTVDSGSIGASGAWRISEGDAGSRVVCEVAVEATGFAKLFEPFMGPSLRKTAKRYEADLAERLG